MEENNTYSDELNINSKNEVLIKTFKGFADAFYLILYSTIFLMVWSFLVILIMSQANYKDERTFLAISIISAIVGIGVIVINIVALNTLYKNSKEASELL